MAKKYLFEITKDIKLPQKIARELGKEMIEKGKFETTLEKVYSFLRSVPFAIMEDVVDLFDDGKINDSVDLKKKVEEKLGEFGEKLEQKIDDEIEKIGSTVQKEVEELNAKVEEVVKNFKTYVSEEKLDKKLTTLITDTHSKIDAIASSIRDEVKQISAVLDNSLKRTEQIDKMIEDVKKLTEKDAELEKKIDTLSQKYDKKFSDLLTRLTVEEIEEKKEEKEQEENGLEDDVGIDEVLEAVDENLLKEVKKISGLVEPAPEEKTEK